MKRSNGGTTMGKGEKVKRERGDGRTNILICVVLFALYFVNVMVGKANIIYGWKVFHLGYVGEFLLLFTAATFLVVVALHSEAVERKNQLNRKENDDV